MPQIAMKQILQRADRIPGHMAYDELRQLAEWAQGLPAGQRWAEIGCLCGRSLLAVGLALPAGSTLVSVDRYWGRHIQAGISSIDVFRELMSTRGTELQLHAVAADSVAASRAYRNSSFAAVFLDGSHDRESVIDDINAWLPKLQPGGRMAGHDYSEIFAGVISAVEDFRHLRLAPFVMLGPGSIWSREVIT